MAANFITNHELRDGSQFQVYHRSEIVKLTINRSVLDDTQSIHIRISQRSLTEDKSALIDRVIVYEPTLLTSEYLGASGIILEPHVPHDVSLIIPVPYQNQVSVVMIVKPPAINSDSQ